MTQVSAGKSITKVNKTKINGEGIDTYSRSILYFVTRKKKLTQLLYVLNR